MSITINQDFEAGAIEVINANHADNIELNLRSDSSADIRQWFYFRVQGVHNQPLRIRFMNAGLATFTSGWQDYRAVASYDQIHWFRVQTRFDGEVLTIEHRPERGAVYYAYFEPYTLERHRHLLARARVSDQVSIDNLGPTLDGRDLNLLVLGDPTARQKVWVIARQHPGETMAEWFVEGMLDALLDSADPFARRLLQNTVFYVVPNMNPDGCARGNLRTNAAGTNLNREWQNPTLERSPEVYRVKQKIHATGCDLFLDIHGDEGLPYIFMSGSDALENFSSTQKAAQNRFIADFMRASPDVQDQFGYAVAPYTSEVLSMATPHIAHTFACLALTLELPFKDNADDPDTKVGWNGARSARLGRAVLQPILQALHIQQQTQDTTPKNSTEKPIWMRTLRHWRDKLKTHDANE